MKPEDSHEDESAHILIIDDDDRIRDLTASYLKKRGFKVSTASDASQARKRLKSLQFNLLILDIMMPGEDGISFLKWLRNECRDNKLTPVIMLTALVETEDRIKGLTAGADDYLPKPFNPEELALRVEAILKRTVETDNARPPLRLGQLTYDANNQELRKNGALIAITTNEAALLTTLAREGGAAISRETIAKTIPIGLERSIDVQVTRLRKKIEPNPKEPIYLQTVRGIGYRLLSD